MTRFILHGGRTSKPSPSNALFYQEFTRVDKPQVEILICLWARDPESKQEVFERDSTQIQRMNVENKKIKIRETLTPHDFGDLARSADVIYFSGGTYLKLYDQVNKVAGFDELIKEKVILGSSAGAFLLCATSLNSFSWQPQDEINIGLGILPINVLCHADIDDQLEFKIAQIKQNSDKPILLLNEGEYTSFVY